MSRRQRLLDVERDHHERWTGGHALVHIDGSTCPACGADVVPETVTEQPLLRHGGYGAARATTRLHCTSYECRWSLLQQVQEERPA